MSANYNHTFTTKTVEHLGEVLQKDGKDAMCFNATVFASAPSNGFSNQINLLRSNPCCTNCVHANIVNRDQTNNYFDKNNPGCNYVITCGSSTIELPLAAEQEDTEGKVVPILLPQ